MPPLPGPPLTKPVEVTLAILGALLVQLPLPVASLKDTDVFTHIGVVPFIAVGNGVTVTLTVVVAVVVPLLTCITNISLPE